MPIPRDADAVFAELTSRRDCGVVHAGLVEARDLGAVASAFGLRATAVYRAIDLAEARRILIAVLHRDLAYRLEIMPRADATRIASDVPSLVPTSRYFTNLDAVSPTDTAGRVEVGTSWRPATSATFDAGVIAVGAAASACVWVEEED